MAERKVRRVLANVIFAKALFKEAVDTDVKRIIAKEEGRWMEEYELQKKVDRLSANIAVIRPHNDLTPIENAKWTSIKEKHLRVDTRGAMSVKRMSCLNNWRIGKFLNKIGRGI